RPSPLARANTSPASPPHARRSRRGRQGGDDDDRLDRMDGFSTGGGAVTPSRRGLFLGAAAGGVASALAAPARTDLDEAWHQAVVERYFGFGDKSSGGPGDTAVGAWLEGELTRAGYVCERQS